MRREIITIVLMLSAIIMSSFIAGCVSTANLWGDTEEGLIMTYRLEEDQLLNYKLSSGNAQVLKMMGQEINMEYSTEYLFSAKCNGKSNNNYNLTFTIDTMSMNVKSPQGEMSPDVSSVFGKQFEMVLSEFGVELDVIGAENINYSMGPGGDRSIKSDFATFFPKFTGQAD